MRLIFAGTPEFAVPPLQRLLDAAAGGTDTDIETVAVLTAPDRAVGRSGRPVPPPVKETAEAAGIPVLQPETIGRSFSRQVASLRPDLLVAVAYGKIFRPYFLEVFPQGGINLHPSLLPKWRGPSPIPAAILAGDATTGVTVQRLAEEMDAGDVLLQRQVSLDTSQTTASLSGQLAEVGAQMLLEVVGQLGRGVAQAISQDHAQATYCHLIAKEDGRIDWSRPAAEIERAVRAYQPWPHAYTTLAGRQMIVDQAAVVEVAENEGADPARSAPAPQPGSVASVDKRRGILVHTGAGRLLIKRVQLQGKRPMDAAAFANGFPQLAESVLGSDAT